MGSTFLVDSTLPTLSYFPRRVCSKHLLWNFQFIEALSGANDKQLIAVILSAWNPYFPIFMKQRDRKVQMHPQAAHSESSMAQNPSMASLQTRSQRRHHCNICRQVKKISSPPGHLDNLRQLVSSGIQRIGALAFTYCTRINGYSRQQAVRAAIIIPLSCYTC
jgi:hypothetical protein